MADLPSQQDLHNRATQAEGDLQRFQDAYDRFVKEWEKIMEEQHQFVKDLHKTVDHQKLATIANYISKIKNSND